MMVKRERKSEGQEIPILDIDYNLFVYSLIYLKSESQFILVRIYFNHCIYYQTAF
jgi:hypothetical protein